jgi:hypothetical protein
MSKFVKAERRKVKLKIAITGPSGSGKTYSALELATGLGQKIAVIDTEKESASLYSDRFEFETLTIDPPYTISKYIEAMKAAEAEKFDVVIVDSLTHAWAGEGGILSKKNAMDARGGNSFTNWGQLTPEQERLVATILNLDVHLVGTIRSKQEYVVEQNEKGKQAPRKVGLAPIQREGMEYEFTTVFDVAMDHAAAVSKDRTGLFDGRIERITKKTGEEFMAWLGGAKAEERPKAEPPKEPEQKPAIASALISEPQRKRLFAIANKSGIPDADVKLILAEYGYESSKDIAWVKYDEIVKRVEAYIPPVVASEDDFAEGF